MSLIEFKQNIEQEAYNIEKFTSPGDIYGGKEEIFKNHPQLKNALQGKDTLPTEDRRRVIKIYLKKYYQENKADYAKGAKRIKSAWNKIEKPIIKTSHVAFKLSVKTNADKQLMLTTSTVNQ